MKVRAKQTIMAVSNEIECEFNVCDRREVAEADRFIGAVLSVPREPFYRDVEPPFTAKRKGESDEGNSDLGSV